MHQVYLGLGSNMGQRQMLLEQAIRLIGERVGKVLRQSSFIETEPWGFESPNKFLKAVIRCESGGDAQRGDQRQCQYECQDLLHEFLLLFLFQGP